MDNELRNSIDYITKKVGKNPGFTTPVNYFDDVEDTIYNNLPGENFPKKQAFSVPNTYFDALEDTILARVDPETKETKVIPIRSRIARFASIAAAASVLLFIGIYYFSVNNNQPLTLTEVENWFDDNINDIDNDDLVVFLESSDLEEEEFISNPINDDILEEYLNTIDTSSLLNEIN